MPHLALGRLVYLNAVDLWNTSRSRSKSNSDEDKSSRSSGSTTSKSRSPHILEETRFLVATSPMGESQSTLPGSESPPQGPTKKHPLTNDYKLSRKVLGVGINGKVLKCTSKTSGQNYALKVRPYRIASLREITMPRLGLNFLCIKVITVQWQWLLI